ncbi:MAG: alanine racemase, partial [Bacteroidales bacterium]|nr:alanine racemase [Bacteroidales bacterium]
EKEFFKNTDEFLAKFNVKTLNHEVVLIKGARDFCFERIANYLEEKTHETVLEVNLKNMIANMNYYRSLLHKETKVMAMVKAFSYGTGGVDVANALQYHGVNYLTVAYADEGVSLRNQNIQLPIMVMNPEQRSVDTIIKYNLQPEIYSFSILKLFLDGIKEHTDIDIRVHIKIDTGMHRLGFLPEEIPALIGILKANKQIVVESVFSHFVAADDPKEDEFSAHQVELLGKVHQQIADELGYRPLKHIANTAGLCRFPQYHFDMVRMGIGLYGINPFVDKNKISNVATLKTIVSQVKSIKAGETVGYNRRFKADRDSVIATISIGYADGLPRSAGNGHARMLINGRLVPIVGNICMDMCMVDVTDVPTQEGDMVIVFGKELPLEDLAQATGLITYELLTGISQRVKRIYVED